MMNSDLGLNEYYVIAKRTIFCVLVRFAVLNTPYGDIGLIYQVSLMSPLIWL